MIKLCDNNPVHPNLRMTTEDMYDSLIARLEAIDSIDRISMDYEYLSCPQPHIRFEFISFERITSIRGIVTSPHWKPLIPQYIDYLNKRIKETHNSLLKSRYYAILALSFGKEKEEAYHSNVSCLKEITHTICDYGTLFEVLYSLIEIYFLIKTKPNPSIDESIKDILNDKDILYINKVHIINIITVSENKNFKVENIDGISDVCELLITNTDNPNLKKRLIENAIKICSKLIGKDSVRYPLEIKKFQEALADNEYNFILDDDGTNIVTPHQNHHILQRIFSLYHCAGAIEKRDKAEQELIKIKNKLQYPSFSQRLYTDSGETFVNQMINSARDANLDSFLFGLSQNLFLTIPCSAIFDKCAEQMDSIDGFQTVNIDINNNSAPVSEGKTHEDSKYRIMGQYLNPITETFTTILLHKIVEKTVTYNKVKTFLLKNTIFGQVYTTRNGMPCRFFDLVELPIHDFFIQLKRVTLHKAINFTIPLDTLSIKIERILRDMLYLNGYSTMKQLPNGKEQMFLLDDILKSEGIKTIYPKDDIDYLKYILTDSGLNIRNSAAHGFYDNTYYITKVGLHYCMFLFVAIIRLAVNYNLKQQS